MLTDLLPYAQYTIQVFHTKASNSKVSAILVSQITATIIQGEPGFTIRKYNVGALAI